MGISLSGLSSGINWQDILDKLQTVMEKKVNLIQDQKKTLNDRLTAWKDLGSKLSELKNSIGDLQDPWDYNKLTAKVTSSDPSVSPSSLFSVNVGNTASMGVHNIKVLQMADYKKVFSESFGSPDQVAGKTGSIVINGSSVELDGKSLNQIKSDINALNAGVSASILKVAENDYRLIITSKTTGAQGFTFNSSNSDMTFTEQAGKNAIISIDGLQIERPTNTISDVIKGVTFQLNKADSSTTVTLSVERDLSSIKDKVKKFVNAYNSVLDEIGKHITSNTTPGAKTGALGSDFTLQTVKSNIQNVYLKGELFNLGVRINDKNRLEFDESTFDQALQSNFEGTTSKLRAFATNMYTQLDRLMDPIDGTLTLKENSLENTIRTLDKRIDSEKSRIDRQIEMMRKQFETMESALSDMQTQSNWLSAQLSSLGGR
ncbi:MAG: flagellar filament capping protein FliD [Syntrophobacterales bacterium]|nr:flagellar filament capping protein FliD [Syntrophobacterales bacterium]